MIAVVVTLMTYRACGKRLFGRGHECVLGPALSCSQSVAVDINQGKLLQGSIPWHAADLVGQRNVQFRLRNASDQLGTER